MSLPIRARMTLWYAALLALVIVGVGAFLVVRLRADLVGLMDGGLRPAADQIAVDYRREGVREFADSAGTVLKGERAMAQLLTPSGAVVTMFGDPVAGQPALTPAERAAALALRPVAVTRALGADGQGFRLVARRVVRDGQADVIVAGQSLRPVQQSVRRVIVLLALAGPAALLAVALGGWWLARCALAPIEAMTASAEAIGPERLHDRVAEPRARDEVAHLARTLNTMLERVEQGAQEQRRLVADTSHELRTPLAAMRTEIDVSLRADDLDPAAQAALRSVREEVDRLNRMVADLLTLAAVDEGVTPAREPADLRTVAAAVLNRLRPMAEARHIRLERRGEPAAVLADPDRLTHAIRNVVENAIAFSPLGGTVTVTTERHGRAVRLSVHDEGPGIAPEHRDAVFQRFFRVDPSRTRATGGSGLGLAIVRELVTAQGGAAWVDDGGSGARVCIELPAVASPSSVRGAFRQRSPGSPSVPGAELER